MPIASRTWSLSSRTRVTLVEWLWFAVCVALCWYGVSWAIRRDSFLILDEIGNLTRFMDVSYGRMMTLFPQWIYNDRPVGFALERLLFDAFGFDYARQVMVFLCVHFANCVLGFLLFRRLGVSRPLAFAGIGFFGSLWTTAQTATYIGAVFDVLCLLFLLSSMLLFFSERLGARLLSAGFFLLALRTKEFAIVAPVLLVVIAIFQTPHPSAWSALKSVSRRAWIHVLIGAIFAVRYLSFVPRMKIVMGPENPYHLSLDPRTILESFSYYTAVIFDAEQTGLARRSVLLAVVFAAVLLYGLYRRSAGIVFALAAYALTLLPVCMMPGNRAPYYVYAPQLFLILLFVVLIEDLAGTLLSGTRLRRIACVGAGLALVAGAVTIRRSTYFTDRIQWLATLRQVSRTSALDASRLLPALPPQTHVYVNHGMQDPWLFIPGPCDFLRLVNTGRSITCVLHEPAEKLWLLYQSDHGPKYFVDYHQDGSLSIVHAGANSE